MMLLLAAVRYVVSGVSGHFYLGQKLLSDTLIMRVVSL